MSVLPLPAQAAGYEVYIQQPLETDADQCFQRQIHGHSLAFMHQAEAAWEPTPAVYPQLSARSLLEGEGAGRKRRSIQEVDMEQDSGEEVEDGAEEGDKGRCAQEQQVGAGRGWGWAGCRDRVEEQQARLGTDKGGGCCCCWQALGEGKIKLAAEKQQIKWAWRQELGGRALVAGRERPVAGPDLPMHILVGPLNRPNLGAW